MQMNNWIFRLALPVVLLGVALISGCEKKPAAPPQAPPPPEVAVTEIAPQTVTLTRELPGRTVPRLIAEVRPQVGGIIKNRLFTEGADVKAGEVLYQIDAAPFEAAVASGEAALERARTAVVAARANLTRAEANLVPLKLKAERYRDLLQSRAVSTQEVDDAVAAESQGVAAVESAQATIAGAEADIGVAEAALKVARINLAYTKVTAPIGGRIGRSQVTTGALVTANQAAPLATIQQLDPIYVDFTQSSSERLQLMQSLNSGQLSKGGKDQAQVSLQLEDGNGYDREGTLKFSDVTVDPSTGSVTLRALFPNPRQLLLPGMFVRGTIREGVREGAILVPQRAVTRNPAGQALVMLVGGEDKVEPRVIKAVRTVGTDWLVDEGLQPGDRVIMEGTQKARPGTTVKPVPFGDPAAGEAAKAPAGK